MNKCYLKSVLGVAFLCTFFTKEIARRCISFEHYYNVISFKNCFGVLYTCN